MSKIKELKKQYYQNYFRRNSKYCQKPLNGIKSVVRLKSTVKTSPNSLFQDRNIIANKTSIVETFNNFFDKELKKRVLNSFFVNPVKETEIEKLIKNLNHNKSLGPCDIPVKILKNHAI